MRYRSSSAYNQLLIAHIISKIIFMKYLPSGRPKLAPKLKMFRIYWHLAQLIFHRVGMIFHLIFQAWACSFIKKETPFLTELIRWLLLKFDWLINFFSRESAKKVENSQLFFLSFFSGWCFKRSDCACPSG